MFLFAGFLIFPFIVYGAAVSPGTVIAEGLLSGSKTIKKISFSRSDASQSQQLVISISGPAAASLSGPETIDIPAGVYATSYPLTINAGTLAAGTYEAAIIGTFTAPPSDRTTQGDSRDAAQTTIITAAKASVRFIVSNESRQEYSIKNVIMEQGEEKQPLGFSFFIINTGNVDVRPTKIQLAIVDQTDPSNIYTEDFLGESLVPVKAFTEQEYTLLTKANLQTGRYFVAVTFYNDEKIVLSREKMPLQIFPQGTLAQKGTLEAFSPDKTIYEQNELVIFDGSFKNQGTVGISAEFMIDVEQGGRRIELLKSNAIFIPAGRTADLSLTTRLPKSGAYTAKGSVSYGIYKSNIIETSISVKGIPLVVIGGAIGALTVVLAIVFWFLRRRKLRQKAHLSNAQQQTNS